VQERQDALYEITDDPSINMMVVVGGFNSSNTSHLQEIAEHKGISSFWVDSAARIDVEGNKVRKRARCMLERLGARMCGGLCCALLSICTCR
jgi:4-hydroxy-3-methylbut-2-enyl diphosphate reductase IspH